MPSKKKMKNHGEILSQAIKSGAFSDTFFSRSSDCFFFVDEKNKHRKLTGINPVLREIFYSKYKFDRKAFRATMKKFGRKQKKKKSSNEKTIVDGVEMNIGIELGPIARGSIVHNQLEILFSRKDNNIDLFKKKYGYIDPFTVSAFGWMKKNGLTPIKSELAISDPGLRLGTAIDLVASDKHGDLVLIEWKTGNPDSFQFYTGKMEGKLGSIMSNCPLNQARLQLFTTYFILKTNYFIPVKKLILVHISDEVIDDYVYETKKIDDLCSFIYDQIERRRQ